MTTKQQEDLLKTLQLRFEISKRFHTISWSQIEAKLLENKKAIESILRMEETGGEPDVIIHDTKTNTFTFCDCAAEAPNGRRSFCYDRQALDERKEHKPKNDVISAAKEMGIELLDEDQYKYLQSLGTFDQKTSSWIKTPKEVRDLGGALFADFRFGRTFIYHNGASSYYAARGFRGLISV